MIEAKIRSILIANEAVGALISKRVYVGILPQKPTYPALTIQPITHNPDNDLAGPGDMQWDRLQIDAWGNTYAAAAELYKAVIDALNGKKFNGTGYTASIIVPPSGGYGYEPSVGIHRRYFDIGVWFELS